MQILILIDHVTLPYLVDGAPPGSMYSHDKNLYQFADQCIRRSCDVVIASAQRHMIEPRYNRVTAVYPYWKQESHTLSRAEVEPDVVVSVFPEALNVKHLYPNAKIVAIIPAIHWAESPERFPGQYVHDLITACRYHIDFFITQNERMKDILHMMMEFLAKWPHRNRILVAPLGIVDEEIRSLPNRSQIRAEMGLKHNDIAIVNSGGVWRWTDFNCFFDAFCTHVKSRRSRIRLYVMGVKQPMNFDHENYTDEFESLVEKHRDVIGSNVVIFNDWDAASKIVKAYTLGSDIGLNVNKPSLENWQSYRIRFLDYLYFKMPVINTYGDEISDRYPDAVFRAEAGNKQSYLAILSAIEVGARTLERKRQRMAQIAEYYSSCRTYGPVVDHILSAPGRNPGDYEQWGQSLIDYTNQIASVEVRHRAREELRNSITNKILKLIY